MQWVIFIHQQIALGSILPKGIITPQSHLLEKDIIHYLKKDIIHRLPEKVIHHLLQGIVHLLPEKDINLLLLTDIHRKVENALCLPPINNKFYLNYKHEYEKRFCYFIGTHHDWFRLQEGSHFDPFNPLDSSNLFNCT